MTDLAGRGALGQKPQKPSAADGRKHMARVAQLGCVICGARPVEVHHVISGRYGQRKASDLETIALCPPHHRLGPDAIHNSKRAWEQRHGPDYGYLPIVAALLDTTTEIDF